MSPVPPPAIFSPMLSLADQDRPEEDQSNTVPALSGVASLNSKTVVVLPW